MRLNSFTLAAKRIVFLHGVFLNQPQNTPMSIFPFLFLVYRLPFKRQRCFILPSQGPCGSLSHRAWLCRIRVLAGSITRRDGQGHFNVQRLLQCSASREGPVRASSTHQRPVGPYSCWWSHPPLTTCHLDSGHCRKLYNRDHEGTDVKYRYNKTLSAQGRRNESSCRD